MIAFGCMVSEAEPYVLYAEPGIQLAAEPNSAIYPFASVGSIGRGYNLLLSTAGAREDLEALVLVHPHAEIADPQLCDKIRAALSDPDVAVLGAAGAAGVTGIAWWEGKVSSGAEVTHRYGENGGGSMPAYSWTQPSPPPADVDTVDGFMLVLSPWAVRNVRFDEGLIYGHGFDLDYCLQVRAQGRKVQTFDVRLIQHRSLEIVSDMELWIEAHVAISEKWDGKLPGAQHAPTSDWKARARRAEAEREASRAMAYSRRLAFDARLQEVQKTIEEATATLSWRATAPLREVNLWRRSRLANRQSRGVG